MARRTYIEQVEADIVELLRTSRTALLTPIVATSARFARRRLGRSN